MEKPYHPRTSASVDSQSIDTTSGGEQRGRDNAKNVDGRKRHIVVDSMGLLLAVLVTAASVDDAAAAPALFARLEGQPMGKVVRMYADSKYHNFKLYEWVEENAAWDLSIVRRPEGGRGLGEAADPLDGRADVRLAGQLPSPEQGPGEERPVVGIVHQAGHDPVDVPPAAALRYGRPNSTIAVQLEPLMGQSLSAGPRRNGRPVAVRAVADRARDIRACPVPDLTSSCIGSPKNLAARSDDTEAD